MSNSLCMNCLIHPFIFDLNFDSWAAQYGEIVTAMELAPEGTGYRMKTRFARFNNLPELMSIFRMCADIQTADMLNLPVPKAVYKNVSVKPSEIQSEMVSDLADRADAVRAGQKTLCPRKTQPTHHHYLIRVLLIKTKSLR